MKKTNSALDLTAHPVSHFLHANVHSDDYPWDDVTLETRGESSDEELDVTVADDMTEYPGGSDDDREIRNMGGFIEEASEIDEDENVDMTDADAPHSETPIFELQGAGADDDAAGESTDEYSSDEQEELVAQAQAEHRVQMRGIQHPQRPRSRGGR